MSAKAQRVALISLTSTIIVVGVKLFAARQSGSISVLAEALQSILDIVMSGLAIFALRVAAIPPDENHPYGHGKVEFLASLAQMIVVLGSAGFILVLAYQRLSSPQPVAWDWGVAAMAYTVVANTLVSRYVLRVSRESNSATLRSEALHLRGDTFASLGVLVGLLLVGLTGWLILDPIVAALFTVVAIGMAFRQLQSVIHALMDGALPRGEISALEAALDTHPEVRGYHDLRTRWVGALRHVELHVMLDDGLSFVAAHEVTEQLESELSRAIGGARVSIHYEPYEAETLHRKLEH